LYDIQVMEKAKELLRKRRDYAQTSLEARKAEVYKKVPRIKQIDREIADRYRQMVAKAFTGEKVKNSEVKSAAVDLRAEKCELLVDAGFPLDYLDLRYECKKCSDTGFVKGQMCSCFIKELNKLSAAESNLSQRMSKETFKNFRLDYYPDDGGSRSPKAIMSKVFDLCKNYAETFSEESANMFFNGPTGLGKTFLSSCIAGEVIAKGYSVIYDSAQNIIDAFESYKFGKNDAPDSVDKYTECDLLIIDDLGTEFITQYSLSVVYTLLNNRINSHKPTIVSSNINGEQMDSYYPKSIVSRLSGEFMTVPFMGSDIRTAKNGRNRKKL